MKKICNCGKKATRTYLVMDKKGAHTIYLCEGCSPKYNYNKIHMQQI